MYITFRLYKLQYRAHGDVWLDLGTPTSMTACKIRRRFMDQADEPLQMRTLFVRQI